MSSMTPERVREIGNSYKLNLSGTANTRPGSVMVLLAYAFLTAFLICGIFLMPYALGAPSDWLFVFGFAAWMALMGLGLSMLFLVSVPKLTGLITTDELFGGLLHVYGPGLHLRYPWERFTSDDYIEMRAQIVQKSSTFVSKDGIGVAFGWTVQYGVFLPLLAAFIRTDEHAIEHGFVEVVEHAGQEIIVEENIDNILKKRTAHEIQDGIEDKLVEEKDVQGNTIEERFGIVVELATVGPPTFDKDYKEALTAKVLRTIITADAKTMASELNISEEKALQTIMMLNKESVSQSIYTIQADKELAQAAPYIVAAMQQMGRMPRSTTNKGGPRGKTTTT